jgi:AGCS family alanine or glycine:cation symporter
VGAFLTLRLGFVQLRRFGHGVVVASGRYDDPNDPGDVSHFQALSTALSATVGIGNIAGVAIAIHWGGPGALFWMWVTAFVGMATKYAEVVLAQHYRRVEADDAGGTVAGGPMHYIERGLGPSWRPLALVFATLLGFTALLTGNGVQANTIADTFSSLFGGPAWIVGLVSAVVVGAVVLGGIHRIGKVAGVLAPAMALIYVTAGLLVLVTHAETVLPTLALVCREAFTPSAGVAGTGAGVFVITMIWGVKRGLFSNEAGQGSAPIAHAAAKTDEPVSEGVVALLEPFIDTIIICSMTALVIVSMGTWKERVPTELELANADAGWVLVEGDGRVRAVPEPSPIQVEHGVARTGGPQLSWNDAPVDRLWLDAEHTRLFTGEIDAATRLARERDGTEHATLYGNAVESGAPLTMLAFRRGLAPFGDFGHHVVFVCVVLFGVSTAISWSYYGDRCALYVLGRGAIMPYRLLFVAMHFVGAVVPLSLAWTLGDIALGLVVLPNLVALVLLSPKVVELTRSYFQRKPWRRG